jgi:hypothetical protein
MLTRNGYLVPERIYPLASLCVGIVFTFGCIGLLGYGMLALMGYRLGAAVTTFCPAGPAATLSLRRS